MAYFHLSIEASALYSIDSPTLEVLVGGVVVSSAVITAQTGVGSDVLLFELEFSGSYPSSLSFRFNDGSAEGGRSITLETVRVNGQAVNGSDLTATLLAQSQSSSLNVAANDHLFGRVEPTAGDLGTVTVTGTAGDDRLNGTSANGDVIDGGTGHDWLRGVGGDDAIIGGDGNDVIFGEGGNDLIMGGLGMDTIFGNDGDDLLYGQDDMDYIIAGDGNDVLSGGLGNDYLLGDAGNDILFGEAGDDWLLGDAGDDYLYGDAGNDTLVGGSGIDVLFGGADNDTLHGEDGDDFLFGEDGIDLISGGAGNDTIGGGIGDDEIYGEAGDDVIAGGDGNDTISGGADNDTIYGDAGNDTLIGGAGADTIDGGADNDVIHGHGLDISTISSILFANPNVVYSNATGSFYQYVSTTQTWDNADTAAQAATLNGVAGHLVTITTAAENSYVASLIGASIWIGANDVDTESTWTWTGGLEQGVSFWQGLAAGTTLNNMYTNWNAGEPNEYGTGEDYLEFQTSGVWNDNGGPNQTALARGYVIEWEAGLMGDDGAADILSGGTGNDFIYGYDGNDTLNGDGDNDVLFGGAGSDTVNGGTGNDILFAYDATATGPTSGGSGGSGSTPINDDFAADLGSWTYADGFFGSSGTSNNYANGVYTGADGNTAAGAMELSLGGIDNNTISTMSGAFQYNFSLSSAMSNAQLTLSYHVLDAVLDGDPFDAGEDLWLYADIDGTTYSNDANPHFFELLGTAAGASYDGGWNTITLNVGALGAGSHTLSLGGLLNSKTWNSEEYDIRFDDITLAESTAVTLLSEDFSTDTGVFTYSDGGFGGSDSANVDVSGVRDTTDGGVANGSLEVYVDGFNNSSFTNASGTWDASIAPADDMTNVQITFSYHHWHSNSNDNGEDSEVYFEFDGTIYDASGGNSFISQALGSAGTTDTGWVTVTIDLPDLTSGSTYNLSLGILHVGANRKNEDAYIRFDDITITGDAASGGGGGGGGSGGGTGADLGTTNVLDGGDGNDTLYGSGGNDTLTGGNGDDVLYSGSSETLDATIAAILAANAGVSYSADTNSFYQVVSSMVDWTVADAAANSSTLSGLTGVNGHLATITSAAEQTFLEGITGGTSSWLGGGDFGSEGVWRWTSGPEAGIQFANSSGTAVNSHFNDWTSGQPNDSNGTQDYLYMLNGTQWADLVVEGDGSTGFVTVPQYIIEWEADTLLSTVDRNILSGGDGLDTLYGSYNGLDVFVFEAASAYNNVDIIESFDAAGHDQIDLSELLTGYDALTNDINDFLQFSESGGNTTISIDANGTTGGASFADVAQINGVTGLDIAQMIAADNLIIA
ncbi:MAG: type I secretion C-terminal target domain-containing protein [Rhodospirillales bacterium]|nr:type I secretion C-terminal target domain-containing protein [Rhodospirillales bacterium]